MRKFTYFLFGVLTAVFVGCGGSQNPTPDLGAEFQSMLEKAAAAEPLVFSAALQVDGPGIDWEGAVGFADPEGGVSMTPEHPVRLASNTKTYVAAAILRLVEQGRLELEPLARTAGERLVAPHRARLQLDDRLEERAHRSAADDRAQLLAP